MKFYCYTIFFILLVLGNGIELHAKKSKSEFNWNKQVFYFTLLDRFYDGDVSNNANVDKKNLMAYHGGDLNGLVQRMDYFRELGTTGLIFTPLLDNRNTDFYGDWAFHGYWPINHFQLDEHWGTFKDLEAFDKAKKKEHMPFLVDIVLNHVAWDHPWLKSRKDWFHKLGPIRDWNNTDQLERGQVTGLPDLNQDNPDVYNFLLKYTEFWIEKTEAQGVRFDAIKHIGHGFWKKFLADIFHYTKAKFKFNNFLKLGELLDGDPKAYIPYVQDGFNSFYNYPLYYSIKDVIADGKSFYNLAARFQELDHSFGAGITWVNFIDNHDLPRFLSLNSHMSAKHLLQALSIAFFYRGIPFLYYGTEELMRGSTGEKGRKSLNFKQRPIFKKIHRLISLRKQYADYLTYEREELMVDDDYYVARYKGIRGDLLVVYSRLGMPLKLKIPIAGQMKKLTSLVSTQSYLVKGGQLQYQSGVTGADIFFVAHNQNGSVHDPIGEVELQISFEGPAQKDFSLVGNLSEIGSWNPIQALKLKEVKPGHYQAQLSVEKDQILIFKFIERKSKKVVWEDKVTNRFIFPSKNIATRYEWNVP